MLEISPKNWAKSRYKSKYNNSFRNANQKDWYPKRTPKLIPLQIKKKLNIKEPNLNDINNNIEYILDNTKPTQITYVPEVQRWKQRHQKEYKYRKDHDYFMDYETDNYSIYYKYSLMDKYYQYMNVSKKMKVPWTVKIDKNRKYEDIYKTMEVPEMDKMNLKWTEYQTLKHLNQCKFKIMNEYNVKDNEYLIKPHLTMNIYDRDSNNKINEYKLIQLNKKYLITSIVIKNCKYKNITVYIGNNTNNISNKLVLNNIKRKNDIISDILNNKSKQYITPLKGQILIAKRTIKCIGKCCKYCNIGSKSIYNSKLLKNWQSKYYNNVHEYWSRCKVIKHTSNGIDIKWLEHTYNRPNTAHISRDQYSTQIQHTTKTKTRNKLLMIKQNRKYERIVYGNGKSENKHEYKDKKYIKWNKVILNIDNEIKDIHLIYGLDTSIEGEWIKIYPNDVQFDIYGIDITNNNDTKYVYGSPALSQDDVNGINGCELNIIKRRRRTRIGVRNHDRFPWKCNCYRCKFWKKLDEHVELKHWRRYINDIRNTNYGSVSEYINKDIINDGNDNTNINTVQSKYMSYNKEDVYVYDFRKTVKNIKKPRISKGNKNKTKLKKNTIKHYSKTNAKIIDFESYWNDMKKEIISCIKKKLKATRDTIKATKPTADASLPVKSYPSPKIIMVKPLAEKIQLNVTATVQVKDKFYWKRFSELYKFPVYSESLFESPYILTYYLERIKLSIKHDNVNIADIIKDRFTYRNHSFDIIPKYNRSINWLCYLPKKYAPINDVSLYCTLQEMIEEYFEFKQIKLYGNLLWKMDNKHYKNIFCDKESCIENINFNIIPILMNFINDKNVIKHILCKYLGYESIPIFTIHSNITIMKHNLKYINNNYYLSNEFRLNNDFPSFFYPKMNVYKFHKKY